MTGMLRPPAASPHPDFALSSARGLRLRPAVASFVPGRASTPLPFRRSNRIRRARHEQTAQASGGSRNGQSSARPADVEDEAGRRAAGARRPDPARPRPASTPADLHTNVLPETHALKYGDGWTRSLLEAPPGPAPRSRAEAAHAAATGGKADRSAARSGLRRRTHPQARQGAEHRSSLPRRGSISGRPHQKRLADGGILERVFPKCPRTSERYSWLSALQGGEVPPLPSPHNPRFACKS